MHDGKAWVIDGLSHRNCLRIAIDCQQTSLLTQLGEDQTRVATATKCAINVDAIRTNIQAVNGLVQ